MTRAAIKGGPGKLSRWDTYNDVWQDIGTIASSTLMDGYKYVNTAWDSTTFSNSKTVTYAVPPGQDHITIAMTGTTTVDYETIENEIRRYMSRMNPAAPVVRDAMSDIIAAMSRASRDYIDKMNAKTRAIPPREFNPYVNASDLLEEFIREAGAHGVRQSEVLALPVDLFIRWLIVKACEADQEDPNVDLDLRAETRRPRPRCVGCGRFMRPSPVALCRPRCAELHFARRELVAA